MTNTTVASKRLFQEYKNLTNDPPEGITAGPVSEENLFLWEALVMGPEGTPFEGGVFPAELKFPADYPLAPPSMRFTCELWHPNGACKWPPLPCKQASKQAADNTISPFPPFPPLTHRAPVCAKCMRVVADSCLL